MTGSVAASRLASVLKPNQRVWVAGGGNEPVALLDALAEAPEAARGVTFIQFPLPGINGFDFTALHPEAELITFFMTPALKASRARFLPMQMRFAWDWLREGPLDVALLGVGRTADGQLVIGPNVDFAAAALEAADVVAAELNRGVAPPAGGMRIERGRIDHLIETNRPPLTMPSPAVDEAARRIGQRVAALIEDGDCLQTGIGAIPAAILGALSDKNDLGLHGGLIDDGGKALVENGNVTGRRKTLDAGQHVAGMALGSQALHEWLAERPDVVFRGANYTHELDVIRRMDRFVSINSAVQVDLFGQVNAEMAGGRQLSGVGGAVDFMRGARASRGGRSVVAMNATARRGTVSRIVPKVEMVTAPRTEVDIVVTEFGVARLRGTTLEERKRALVAIAHPRFRDELMAAP